MGCVLAGAVTALMADMLFVHDAGTWRRSPAARDGMPEWMVRAMRRAGLRVTNAPVPSRRESLDRVMPEPGRISAAITVILGSSDPVAALPVVVGALRERRRSVA